MLPHPPVMTLFVDTQLVTACAYNYRSLSGNFSRQCTADGSLTGEALVCIPGLRLLSASIDMNVAEIKNTILNASRLDECTIPVSSGSVLRVSPPATASAVTINETVKAECAENYVRVSGESSRRCLPGGYLEGEALHCAPGSPLIMPL